jgi:L-glyceraldehyde 3-phosphate reductase
MNDTDRYDRMRYRRAGRSGLELPAVSLGLWHNFGSVDPFENARAMALRAFDLGITHFDLANNYGPAPGSAEETFGRILRDDLAGHRDELIISTKAGWRMWPGPYGDGGSRKYLLASLDASLRRLGVDYVDIFYHHRPDPQTPVEESMAALVQAAHQGKALYVGISAYDPAGTAEALAILRSLGAPVVIHQPLYNMLDRAAEAGLLGLLEEEGLGCIAFSPLAQGLLTDRYLERIPPGSRAARPDSFLHPDRVTEEIRRRVRCLSEIASRRGQSLAQMAVAWVLRHAAVTSALVGASRVEQVEANVAALDNVTFTSDELDAIDACLTNNPGPDPPPRG